MPPELQQALIILGVTVIGIVIAIGAGITLVINANFKRRAAKIEADGKWDREQLELKLTTEAQQRQIAYEEKMAEIAEKADMRAALDRQSQQLENAVNAIVDIAKSDSRKTEVLAANTNALSANTQTIEIFGDRMDELAKVTMESADNISATRKAAETAIAEHAVINARLDTIDARLNNVIALFTPVPELPEAAGQ